MLKIDDIKVGDSACSVKTITEELVQQFAIISGDYNPIHLDDEFASKSVFGRKISHGMLSASFFSDLFARELPGPGSIYISQSINFKAPVFIGVEIYSQVTVININQSKRRVYFDTKAYVDNKLVTAGEAVLLIPEGGL